MVLRPLACAIALWGALLPAQAPQHSPAPGPPPLQAGEGLAVSGSDGEVHGYGASKAEAAMGVLARLVWLKFEGNEWAARGLTYKCKGTAEALDGAGAKGHGRVDLDGALRADCTRAFLAWMAQSADEWRKVYGEGVARARLDDTFRPFLGGRLPRGETLPAFTPAWPGEGELLRTSPEGFLRWLNDPEQAELLSRCRRTLGSRSFHFKDLAEMEDWWFQAGPGPGGAGTWTVGGNGEIVAVLHQPGAGSAAEGVARFKAIMGIKRK